MTQYARSDIVRINFGEMGCGIPHSRPRRGKDSDGEYVPVWGIDCQPCEAHLDEHTWSKTRHRVPLTPDEEEEMRELAERTRAEEERARLQIQQDMSRARRDQIRADFGGADNPDDVVITKSADDAPPAPKAAPSSSAADYAALDKGSLKDLARDRNLSVGGTKDDLVARLVAHDNEEDS